MEYPQPYLTENSVRNYPFHDQASLTNDSGTFRLPDDFLLDAQFTVTSVLPAYVALTQLVKDRVDVTNYYYFTFTLYDIAQAPLGSYVLTTTNADTFTTATYQNVDKSVSIKIVFGESAKNLLASTNIFTHNFVGFAPLSSIFAAAAFSSGTLVLPQPEVSSLTFQNYEGSTVVDLVVFDQDSVTLEAGANVQFTNDSGGLGIAIEPGAGTGLYDGCDTTPGVIKSIDGVLPDSNGNYNIVGGDCWNLLHLEAGLQLEHTCKPKCDETELAALAFYLNRIKDALVRMAEEANLSGAKLAAQMEAYRLYIESLKSLNGPYIEASSAISRSVQKLYASLAVGIYNPIVVAGSSGLNMSLTVTPQEASSWAYEPSSSVLKIGTHQQSLPTLGFGVTNFPCRSSSEYDFALYTTNLLETNRHVEIKLEETSGAHPAKAYKFKTLVPTAIYFDFKYNKVWDSTDFRYFFTLDLADAGITTGSSTRNTNVSINFSSALTIDASTVKLFANNVVTPIALTDLHKVTLSHSSIDFSKKAVITFEAFTNSSGITAVINTSTDSPVSSFNRTLVII